MKPWLVTGAAGFIGARMVECLNREKVPLVSVDVLSFFDERSEHQGLDFGKRIDRDALQGWLGSEKPDLAGVIHLGASSSTAERNWDFLNRVNVQYSKDLWEFCTRQKLPFLYASSAATYGDGALGFSDDETQFSALKPLNPYGESKRLFDLWAIEQEKAGIHPPAWAGFKFFNVYGFGERHKTGQSSPILPFFDQARTQGKVRLFKSHRPEIRDGEQRRDFVAVSDVVDVLEFARKGGLRRGIYNLGTGRARTFLELARAVFQALNLPQQIEFIDTPAAFREGYQYFTEARMEKLAAQGYRRPFTSLEQGVKVYVERLQAAISD